MNTKIKIGALAVALSLSANIINAATIAGWTFEVNTPADLSDSSNLPSFSADVGTGTASALHAGSATDWSTPTGNGSANAFSSNTWAIGDYYQFSVNGAGYDSFTITWDQTGSNTGPKDFKLSYSINGADFIDVLSYSLVNVTWSNTTESAAGTDDFSATITPTGVVGTILFRMVATSTSPIGSTATFGAAGTSRVDNVFIDGALSSVPEPSTYAAIAGALVLIGVVLHRRRCAGIKAA